MCFRAFSLERYVISNPGLDVHTRECQNEYAKWVGFGTADAIPNYCSFEVYCGIRDKCIEANESVLVKKISKIYAMLV